jgi:hypothetical protein
MKIEQLPKESQSKIDELLRGIQQALKGSKSAHTRATSASTMPNGWTPKDVLVGGDIRAPSKPQFNYDTRTISDLHRTVLQSGDGLLFGIVVHAERPSAEGEWELKTKLVSRAEHQEVEAARKPIDAEVECELRRLTDRPKWERVSYGFRVLGKAPELIRSVGGTIERLEARPELTALLPRAQAVYKAARLDLLTALWTLRPAGLEFMGYWE